jgi:HEAT repeat protein
MDKPSRESFRSVWPKVSRARRNEIVAAMVKLAEENVDVDFNFVLRLSLQDEDEDTRAQAISGLWEDENPTLISPLLHILSEDQSERVRAEAAAALGHFILQGELGRLDMSLAFAIQETLLRVYSTLTESIEVRRRALESLAFSGDEVVHDIIEAAYNDADDRMIASAIFAMGRSADSRWERIVLRELENSKPEIRFEAARAAGELELVEAVHMLGELAMEDSDDQVREVSIRALGQIGGKEARRVLETLEETETNEQLQDAVAEALDELAFLEDALDVPPLYEIDGLDLDGDDGEGHEDDEDY